MSEALEDILRLCIAIDERACAAYGHLARLEDDPAVAAFWRRMASEEEHHLDYWRDLLRLEQTEGLPEVFDEPEQVARELQSVLIEVGDLAERIPAIAHRDRAFLLAFGLEFHLLHPAFTTLLTLLRGQWPQDPDEEYDKHINGFLDALERWAASTPELRFMASAIRRIWRQNRELQRQSHIDPLTGIYNRRGLDEVVLPLAYLASRNHEPVAVLVADVDQLKPINDRFGHPKGDEVLRGVARILQDQLRRSDVPARIGGDEFSVFLPSVDPAALPDLAERVRAAVEAAEFGGARATVSVGVAHGHIGRDITASVSTLTRRADAALYQAKAKGRNAAVVSP